MVGIYSIINKVNNKRYIGSAKDLAKRLTDHRCRLNTNTHVNKPLQRSWNKYGAESFEFVVLEVLEDTSKLIEREQFHIDSYNFDTLYNILPIANNSLGYKFTDEQIQKMKEIRSANPPMKGKKHSEETKRKISEKNKGLKLTPEQYQKLKDSHIGVRPSEETRRKMSEAQRKRVMSEEHKQKIIAMNKARTGVKHTEETKRKMREAHKGRRLTDEDVEKMKQLYKDGTTQKKLSEIYGINQGYISKILSGKGRQ